MAIVTGIDISPIQPLWVPPNCRFYIEDAEQEWSWDEGSFDFIHVRHMVGAISDWPQLYRQAFHHLKPGGWFEHCDFDITTRSDTDMVDENHIFNRWAANFFESGARTGRSFDFCVKGDMKKWMEEAGFVDIVHRHWKIPIGAWARDPKMKELGVFTFAFIDKSLEGFALFLLNQVLGWPMDRVQEHVKEMRDALHRSRLMPYFIL
jgi:SAM-dependent methyltransferase